MFLIYYNTLQYIVETCTYVNIYDNASHVDYDNRFGANLCDCL